TVTSGGSLTIAGANSRDGSATFTAGAGTMAVVDNANLSVRNGDLTIQNNDANGRITFGAGAQVNVTADVGVAGGAITVSIGAVGTAKLGHAPANYWQPTVGPGGSIFYGDSGITTSGSITDNLANINGGTLTFNAASPGQINLGGGVRFNASSTSAALTSLDFSDSVLLSYIMQHQTPDVIGHTAFYV